MEALTTGMTSDSSDSNVLQIRKVESQEVDFPPQTMFTMQIRIDERQEKTRGESVPIEGSVPGTNL